MAINLSTSPVGQHFDRPDAYTTRHKNIHKQKHPHPLIKRDRHTHTFILKYPPPPTHTHNYTPLTHKVADIEKDNTNVKYVNEVAL